MLLFCHSSECGCFWVSGLFGLGQLRRGCPLRRFSVVRDGAQSNMRLVFMSAAERSMLESFKLLRANSRKPPY